MRSNNFGNPAWSVCDEAQFIYDQIELGDRVGCFFDEENVMKWSILYDVQLNREELIYNLPLNFFTTSAHNG